MMQPSKPLLKPYSALFFEELGGYEIFEKSTPSTTDNSRELEIAKATYDELASYIPSVDSEFARATLFKQLDTVAKRNSKLENQPTPMENLFMPLLDRLINNVGTNWTQKGVDS